MQFDDEGTVVNELMYHPRWFGFVHRIVHRRKDVACALCRYVWRRLEATPGFNERMRAAEADLAAGGGVLWRDVRDA